MIEKLTSLILGECKLNDSRDVLKIIKKEFSLSDIEYVELLGQINNYYLLIDIFKNNLRRDLANVINKHENEDHIIRNICDICLPFPKLISLLLNLKSVQKLNKQTANDLIENILNSSNVQKKNNNVLKLFVSEEISNNINFESQFDISRISDLYKIGMDENTMLFDSIFILGKNIRFDDRNKFKYLATTIQLRNNLLNVFSGDHKLINNISIKKLDCVILYSIIYHYLKMFCYFGNNIKPVYEISQISCFDIDQLIQYFIDYQKIFKLDTNALFETLINYYQDILIENLDDLFEYIDIKYQIYLIDKLEEIGIQYNALNKDALEEGYFEFKRSLLENEIRFNPMYSATSLFTEQLHITKSLNS